MFLSGTVVHFYLLSKHSGAGMLDCMADFIASCFPKCCSCSASPRVRSEISWCVTANIWCCTCLLCHSNQCVALPPCGLNFHFPKDKYCQLWQINIFSYTYLWPLYFIWWRVCPVYKLVYFIFLQLSFKISSYISDMSPFLKVTFKVFLHLCLVFSFV